jgi:hypothetical protein
MSPTEDYSSIADASKPNAGRVYDYLLGGNHNFEIDRQAAQQVLSVAPFMREMVKLIRWFLGEAVRRLLDQGFTHFLDFASGLPTVDHIHQIAPEGTKVIYSDLDPVTVAYARQIIGENPNIRYVHSNAGKGELLLNSAEVKELFGKVRKAAIGFNGIAWFLTDEQVSHTMKKLYEWADKGSKIFICEGDAETVGPELQVFDEIYRNMGQPVYHRSKERLAELVKPWVLDKPGFMLLEDWIELDKRVADEEISTWGGGGFVGAILKK